MRAPLAIPARPVPTCSDLPCDKIPPCGGRLAYASVKSASARQPGLFTFPRLLPKRTTADPPPADSPLPTPCRVPATCAVPRRSSTTREPPPDRLYRARRRQHHHCVVPWSSRLSHAATETL